MPAKSGDTFVRWARRTQLIETAVTVLARDGVDGASISAIARAAGVSRGVVTYHFADLADLADQVVVAVYDRARADLAPRLAAAAGPDERLAAFVRGSVELYAARRADMAALHVIFTLPVVARDTHPEHRRETRELVTLLEEGQETGIFRTFDAPLMAAVLRGALDVAATRVAGGADAQACTAELVTLFRAATRADAVAVSTP